MFSTRNNLEMESNRILKIGFTVSFVLVFQFKFEKEKNIDFINKITERIENDTQLMFGFPFSWSWHNNLNILDFVVSNG